jgi:cytochrome c
MVKRVQHWYREHGQERTFAAIADKDNPEFHKGELYPFVFDLNAVNVTNGGRQALVGKSLASVKDQDGRYVIREMIALAVQSGSAWVAYQWPNPGTGRIERKASYVERMGDYVVGVGVYEPVD